MAMLVSMLRIMTTPVNTMALLIATAATSSVVRALAAAKILQREAAKQPTRDGEIPHGVSSL